MEPWHVCGVVNGAAAYRVEHERVDAALVDVDGVVDIPTAHVRVEVPIAARAYLPVVGRVRVAAGAYPIALLQAGYAEARTRQSPGHGGTGRARADDQYVCAFVFHSVVGGIKPRCRCAYERIIPLRAADIARNVVNADIARRSRR